MLWNQYVHDSKWFSGCFLYRAWKQIIQRLSFSSHHNLYIQSNTILTRIPSAITSPGETTDIHGDSTRIDSIYLRASYTIVSHCIEVIFTAEPSDLSNNAPWHIAISHITPSKGIIFSSFIIASTNHRTCQTTKTATSLQPSFKQRTLLHCFQPHQFGIHCFQPHQFDQLHPFVFVVNYFYYIIRIALASRACSISIFHLQSNLHRNSQCTHPKTILVA